MAFNLCVPGHTTPSEMSEVISEVRELGKGEVEWSINNWKSDYDMLKKHATCPIEIWGASEKPPIKLEFYFKCNSLETTEEAENVQMTAKEEWLSLTVRHISGGTLPMGLRVWVKPGIKHLNDVTVNHKYGIRVDTDLPEAGTVKQRFINLGTVFSDKYGEVQYRRGQPKDKKLKFQITVSILKFGGETAVDNAWDR